MIKYTDTQVTFREIPDEITLCINISGCPNHCEGCHSSYLSEDIGEELTYDRILRLITTNSGITCVAFMGGDQNPGYINSCASIIREGEIPVKIAWYSGKSQLSSDIDLKNFDFIKLGPYIPQKGPLDNPSTNQRFYEVLHYPESTGILIPEHRLSDVTYKF